MSNVVKHFLEATAPESLAEAQARLAEHERWLFRVFDLILTEDPHAIACLEVELEFTQMEAVDDLIETTDWASYPGLEGFRGNRRTPAERLKTFRKALRESKVMESR